MPPHGHDREQGGSKVAQGLVEPAGVVSVFPVSDMGVDVVQGVWEVCGLVGLLEVTLVAFDMAVEPG